MRRFSVLRREDTARRDAAADAAIRERLKSSMRRRMSGGLVSLLIRRARLCGHAGTAKGLWLVLKDLAAREAGQHYRRGRLPDQRLVEALALEIATAAEQPEG